MLSESLVNIERDIYSLEGSYLESTKDYGNVIKGWDRYLSYGKTSNNNSAVNEKRKFRQSQRIFSRSSVTSMSALGIAGEKVDTTHIEEVDQGLPSLDMNMPGTSSIKDSPRQVIKKAAVSSKTTGGKPPLGELRMTLASRPTVVETKPAVNRKRLPFNSRASEPVMSASSKDALRKSKVH